MSRSAPPRQESVRSAAPPSLPKLSRARLAVEILVSYVQVRWMVRRRELPRVVDSIRAVPPRRRGQVLPDGRRDGYRISRAVVWTLESLPIDSRCLMRSLVLLRVLKRRGVHGTLVIAVRPPVGGELDAHAWVEVEGTPYLIPGGAGYGRLLTL